jgi:hypothetical protein
VSNVRNLIKNRMDHLQILMEGQAHIDRPEYVDGVIESVSKFWSALLDEDKDYIHCAKDALENKTEWKL